MKLRDGFELLVPSRDAVPGQVPAPKPTPEPVMLLDSSSQDRDYRCLASSPRSEHGRASNTELRLSWPRDHILLIEVVGHGYASLAPAIVARFEAGLRSQQAIVLFFDFFQMPSYDAAYRRDLQAWGASHLRDIAAMHLVTESRLVRMGATMANLVLGGRLATHERRAPFDLALSRALAGSHEPT